MPDTRPDMMQLRLVVKRPLYRYLSRKPEILHILKIPILLCPNLSPSKKYLTLLVKVNVHLVWPDAETAP